MNTETILTVLTALLGGCNVFQFIWWKAEKQKHQAEADSASVEVKHKAEDLRQDQYDYLMEKVAKFQNDYIEMSEQLRKESRRHIDEITEVDQKYQSIISQKQDEMAEIKAQLTYFKGIRCYKSDCPDRILKQIKNDNNKTAAAGCDAECKESRRRVCPDTK